MNSNVVKKGGNDGDRTSGDCISRQRSVDTLRKMQTYKLFAGDDMLLINQAEAQTELMMLPSVQPERKGRWIKSDMQRWYDVWLCSECGEKTDSAVMSKPRYKYCPMCGAKMERGKKMNEKERKSCIFTIKTLMNLAYNIHGVMDVVDVENCKKIIEMLGSGYLAGRWMTDDSELGIKCDKCGKSFSDYINAGTGYVFLEETPNFCPNCGADMKGEQDE